MASGLGYHGGQSRCYAYFNTFQTCFAANQDQPGNCKLKAQDYIECLHHIKEHTRQKIVQAEYGKQVRDAAQHDKELAEALRTSNVQVGLGLIQKAKADKESQQS